MILWANDVIVFLVLEVLLLGLLTVAGVEAVRILRRWDFQSTTSAQYALEKRAYLVVLIVLFCFAIKIILLPCFAYVVDTLAAIIPGAMCGAGVLNANAYGPFLLGLKVIVPGLAGLWLLLNRQDLKAVDYPYFRAKLRLFLVIYLFVVLESLGDVLYFTHISTLSPVQCCSIIYGVQGVVDTRPMGLTPGALLALFYLLYGLILVLGWARYAALNLVANIAFLFIGYHAVVSFFGPYIYELPTHKCPFCLLQGDYFYVGYLIWGLLLLGVYFGVYGFVLRRLLGRDLAYTYRYNRLCVSLFVLICSLYVGVYYIRNGVFLS